MGFSTIAPLEYFETHTTLAYVDSRNPNCVEKLRKLYRRPTRQAFGSTLILESMFPTTMWAEGRGDLSTYEGN